MRENCTYSLRGGRWPARKRATSDPTVALPGADDAPAIKPGFLRIVGDRAVQVVVERDGRLRREHPTRLDKVAPYQKLNRNANWNCRFVPDPTVFETVWVSAPKLPPAAAAVYAWPG